MSKTKYSNIEKKMPISKGIYEVKGVLEAINDFYYANSYWDGEVFRNVKTRDVKLINIVSWRRCQESPQSA